jgi:hypothetical protein
MPVSYMGSTLLTYALVASQTQNKVTYLGNSRLKTVVLLLCQPAFPLSSFANVDYFWMGFLQYITEILDFDHD